MAIKNYTQDEKDAIVAEYNLSGKGVFSFYTEKKKAGQDVPALQTLKKWIDGSQPKTTSSTNLYAEFTQSLLPQDVDKKYIAFLEAKVTSLQARIVELENKE